MKKLYLIILLAAVTLSGMAQTIGEAFYIYRNDGQFNAFFRGEVQSIDYSYEDADGNTYDEIVTQIVTTADSIYKIPIAVIDSLSFIQPETIFHPSVVQMEQKGLSGYLQSVDGMSLLFKPSIPQSLQPKVGDILLSTEFGSSLLPDGFVGKVLSVQMQSGVLRVDCEAVSDIFEIFEQFISIEKIQDENAKAVSHRSSGDWISNRNSLNFNLGYSHKLPGQDNEVSLSGSVDGTYIATVTYNITRSNQYINLRIDHDWQYGAHLNFKHEIGNFGPLKGLEASLPAIRFPAVAPVFKFQISGAPFVKGEGNMEMGLSFNSPVHSYVGQVIYDNGIWTGWNHKKPSQEANIPSVDAAFSLNGSAQAGCMVDLWLGLDIFGSAFKLGTGLDFYIGPKLSGDFSMKVGSENPVSYYSIYKDCKIGIDWLHVDYEFFGEAALAGHKFPKSVFCNGSIQSPLNHEWYIMPEFSDLSVSMDNDKREVTVSTIPSRDILFPLSVGMGLYDAEGNLLNTKYEAQKYKRENEGFEIEQTFPSLEVGKDYTAKPMVKILGGEIPAFPDETFKLDVPYCPDENHPHMIDLGLPSGTKWACCNLGASTKEETGLYLAWGEHSEKEYYKYSTYSFWNDANGNGKWDEGEFNDIGIDISGTEYDAATSMWRNGWHMPSIEHIQELISNCEWTWSSYNGMNGYNVEGINGNRIFLPATGYRKDYDLIYHNVQGKYWSSTRSADPCDAQGLNFTSTGKGLANNWDRHNGRCVRPIHQ